MSRSARGGWDRKRQSISTEGSIDPAWSPDGQALFFLGLRGGGVPPDEMAVVAIHSMSRLSMTAACTASRVEKRADAPTRSRARSVSASVTSKTTGQVWTKRS